MNIPNIPESKHTYTLDNILVHNIFRLRNKRISDVYIGGEISFSKDYLLLPSGKYNIREIMNGFNYRLDQRFPEITWNLLKNGKETDADFDGASVIIDGNKYLIDLKTLNISGTPLSIGVGENQEIKDRVEEIIGE